MKRKRDRLTFLRQQLRLMSVLFALLLALNLVLLALVWEMMA